MTTLGTGKAQYKNKKYNIKDGSAKSTALTHVWPIRRLYRPTVHTQARFPYKRNRLRCVRCVRCVWMETGLNASACVGKQPIMVATASTEHPIGCCFKRLRLGLFPSKRNALNASYCVWMETGLHTPRCVIVGRNLRHSAFNCRASRMTLHAVVFVTYMQLNFLYYRLANCCSWIYNQDGLTHRIQCI